MCGLGKGNAKIQKKKKVEAVLCVCYKGIGKGKADPSQARRGPEDSRKLRFPDFMTTAGGKVVTLRTGHFYPRKYAYYPFLLEAESTPGP